MAAYPRGSQYPERDRRICQQVADSDLTLDQIGAQYGITRERVRQIAKRAGIAIDQTGRSRRVREAACQREQEAVEQAAQASLAAGHVVTGNDHGLDISALVVHRAVVASGQWVPRPDTARGREQVHTDDAIIDALRRFASKFGSPSFTNTDYEQGREPGDPSTATIAARLGWANAMDEAGLQTTYRNAAPRSDKISEERCWQAVEQAVDAFGPSVSISQYNSARRDAGWPTVRTLRSGVGTTWAAAINQVMAARTGPA